MRGSILFSAAFLAGTYGASASAADLAVTPVKTAAGLEKIQNIVVIYAENRSFDNLYGFFPGANAFGTSPGTNTRSAIATARC
jgi:phospholipase C